MRLAARLMPSAIFTAEMDPRNACEALHPAEEAAVARAIDRRRREFSAGRQCARRAMADLGEPPAPIPQGPDRAPVWPEGLVGSISHAETWCAAAVARIADGVRGIGLDIEPAEPIDEGLLRIICVPEERAFIAAQPEERRGLIARLFFSAKEAAYKCQYCVSRTMLSYHAMRIHVDLAARQFVAVFQVAAGPFRPGDELRGRLLIEGGHMVTAVTLSQDDHPALRA